MNKVYNYGDKVKVDFKGNDEYYKVLDTYKEDGILMYTLCQWDKPQFTLQVMCVFVKPSDWVDPIAEYTKDFVGKTVRDIEADEDELKIYFTDGTCMCVGADLVQETWDLKYGDQS